MRRFLTPRWLLGHAAALILMAACLGLGWWQVVRAGEGNLRSYVYAVEWPVFAGFVAFIWFREVRQARTATDDADGQAQVADPAPQPSPRVAQPVSPPRPPRADDGDDELAAYNRMLAWLNANPGRRVSDYPG